MRVHIGVAFADSDAADLSWSIAAPPVVPLDRVCCPLPGLGIELDLGILGASHQVLVRTAGGEVVSVERVACGTAGSLPEAATASVAGCGYRFRSSVRLAAPGRVTALASLLDRELTPRHDAIVAAFPGQPDAITAIAAHVRSGDDTHTAVGWRTWHLYPARAQVVTTRSEIAWRSTARPAPIAGGVTQSGP